MEPPIDQLKCGYHPHVLDNKSLMHAKEAEDCSLRALVKKIAEYDTDSLFNMFRK